MSTWAFKACVIGLSVVATLALANGASAQVVFNVDSTLDQIDDDTSDGVCHTAANTCTLRAAVMQANLSTGAGATIVLPAGVYVLTRPATGVDGDDSGDLNLAAPASGNPVLSIVGAGQSATLIDANQQYRVFTVIYGRTAVLSHLTVRNGYAEHGGGILSSGSLTMNRCTVSGNTADGGFGGGIASFYELDLHDCTIRGNSADQHGGGIYADSLVSMERTEIVSNSAVGDGGGIFSVGPLDISASSIRQNISLRDGGGIFSDWESLTLTHTTIYGNSADGSGGGIYFASPSSLAIVSSSTIAWNGADADVDLGWGGGIFVEAGSSFHLRNTLVAGNILNNKPIYDDCSGTVNSWGRNLFWVPGVGCSLVIQTGSASTLDSLDGLEPLQMNGGPTATIALLPGSNAIDGGDPELGCVGPDLLPLATDQRGAARVFGASCDVGAYEAGTLFFDGFESGDLSAW